MPEVISCPECAGQLRVKDEMLGKKVKCPKCKNIFVAAAEEEDELDEVVEEDEGDRPRKRRRDEEDDEEDRQRKRRDEDEDEEEDRPRKRRRDDEDEEDIPARTSRRWRDAEDDEDRPSWRRRRDEEDEDRPRRSRSDEDEDDRPIRAANPRVGWRKVAKGLGLIAISLYMYAGSVIAAVVVILTGAMIGTGQFSLRGASMGTALAGGAFIGCMLLVVGFVMFAASVVGLIGDCFNLAVPSNRDGSLKGLAIATLACAGLAAFLQLLVYIPGNPLFLVLGIVLPLLQLGACVCFLILLRGIALNCRRSDLATSVMTYMIATVCTVVGSLLVFGLTLLILWFGVRDPELAAIIGITVCVTIVVALIGLIFWQATLVSKVVAAVENEAKRSKPR